MNNLYIGCKKCDYKEVDIMSVRESFYKQKEKITPIAVITYICPNCGYSEEEEHYLYKRS